MDKNGIKKAVFVGIIASIIIIYFIEPFFQFLWAYMGPLFSGLYGVKLDMICKDAARGFTNKESVYLILVLISLMFGLPCSILSFYFKVKSNKIEKRPILDNKYIGKPFTIIFFILFFLWFFNAAHSFVFNYLMNTTFLQKLIVLKPVLTEQQEEEFRAMWALMGNRADFKMIQKKLDEVAEEHGVKLPEPLIN